MRLLTRSEALEVLETTFNCGPDAIESGSIEATVAGVDVQSAKADVESYLAFIAAEIDPDSITITRDEIEGSSLDCALIFIKTGENA
jgi:hypothetical protein